MEIKDFTFRADDLRVCKTHGAIALLLAYGVDGGVFEVLLCPRCIGERSSELIKQRIPLSS